LPEDVRRRVAFHEAGHAVAAVHYGGTVERVEIYDEENVEADDRWAHVVSDIPVSLWGRPVALIAGFVAEWIIVQRDVGRDEGGDPVAFISEAVGGDLLSNGEVWDTLLYLARPFELGDLAEAPDAAKYRRALAWLVAQVEPMLEEHWGHLTDLANEILARGSLTGADAMSILSWDQPAG
jgi:hypothetical protein